MAPPRRRGHTIKKSGCAGLALLAALLTGLLARLLLLLLARLLAAAALLLAALTRARVVLLLLAGILVGICHSNLLLEGLGFRPMPNSPTHETVQSCVAIEKNGPARPRNSSQFGSEFT
jgi:hypothetical protein